MPFDALEFGRAVRDLRENAGLTQEDLGRAAGYRTGAAVSISRLETGKVKPGLDRMESIAEALGVDLVELEARASNPNRDAQRANERPNDREQRVTYEVAERTDRLSQATGAFTQAYENVTQRFLFKFGKVVERVEGEPPVEPQSVNETGAAFMPRSQVAEKFTESEVTAASAIAAGLVLTLLKSGTFSGSVRAIGVAGIGAVAVKVLADSALALIMSTRKQRHDRMRRLDEIEEHLAATKEGAEALVSRLPLATELFNYIAVHAGHALDRWERGLGDPSPTWASLQAEDLDRFRDFVVIAQTAFALRSEFEILSSASPDDLQVKAATVDALLALASEVVESRV